MPTKLDIFKATKYYSDYVSVIRIVISFAFLIVFYIPYFIKGSANMLYVSVLVALAMNRFTALVFPSTHNK
ncbi:hypothetical protein FO519_010163, partial [Halicephalobus sp. NKZ332]